MNSSYFKTGKRLQTAINNAEKIEGFQEYLDMNFVYLYFDLDGREAKEALNGKRFECPYWIENYMGDCLCEYIEGYYEPLKIGKIMKGYKYIDSQPLPEEIEHQAEDGKCAYEYRGHSFLRIWEKL